MIGNTGGPSAPAYKYAPITKHDTDTFAPTRGLLVGTAGTANLTEIDDTERTNVPLQAGYNPLICKRIKTGGTASDIWGLY